MPLISPNLVLPPKPKQASVQAVQSQPKVSAARAYAGMDYLRKRVAFRLNGRLGNILFQIAAIDAYARTHGICPEFVVTEDLQPLVTKYAQSILKPAAGYFRYGPVPKDYKIVKHPHFHYVPLPTPEEVGAARFCFEGTYFQSPQYVEFGNQPLRLIKFPDDMGNEWLDSIFRSCPMVSLHVRRGDYLNLQQHHPVLPPSYYKEALRECREDLGTDNFDIVVFSDDIEFCKAHLPASLGLAGEKPPSRILFVPPSLSETQSLYLMALCECSIIANSSFSWWGAYLGGNHKFVVAPRKWFGPAYSNLKTSDIYCPSWKVI